MLHIYPATFELKTILNNYKKNFNGFIIKFTQEKAVRMGGTVITLLISKITSNVVNKYT